MFTIWVSIAALSIFALIAELLLNYANNYLVYQEDSIKERIDTLLPQSQCGQCGYLNCYFYAEAIANNGESINKCIPGGEIVMLNIAKQINAEPQQIEEKPSLLSDKELVAWINESQCIGCTKCSQVCPVDAIIGTTRMIHTVVSDYCTGCSLCIAPCPTSCIKMQSTTKNTTIQLDL